MKLSEWLHEDDIAILHVAVYYGLPTFGHKNCYRHIEPSQHPLQHVTGEATLAIKHCIACGKPLIPAKLPEGYSIEQDGDTFYLRYQGMLTGYDFVSEFAARVFCWKL